MFPFLTTKKNYEASKLFHYLSKHKVFFWNDDGEIIANGNILDNSNIFELISHAVHNDSTHPIGMKFFYQTLTKNNIPIRYISNKFGRNVMNKSLLNETSIWRPPGYLNRKFYKHE